MNPNSNPATQDWLPQAAEALERRAPERQARMFDTVKVAPETFRSVTFLDCAARKEYVQGQRVPEDQKPQKRNADQVPLWSVKVLVETWRGRDELLQVTVPMHSNPLDKFARGDAVQLVGMTFGVTAKRDGGGFVTWQSADDIAPVSVAATKQPAAS